MIYYFLAQGLVESIRCHLECIFLRLSSKVCCSICRSNESFCSEHKNFSRISIQTSTFVDIQITITKLATEQGLVFVLRTFSNILTVCSTVIKQLGFIRMIIYPIDPWLEKSWRPSKDDLLVCYILDNVEPFCE